MREIAATRRRFGYRRVVGTHETLLAYLVRRLLENGAHSSFVNRIGDPAVSVGELIADPIGVVRSMPILGAPHEAIALPADIYEARTNSAGLDLSDEATLTMLVGALTEAHGAAGRPAPAARPAGPQPGRPPRYRWPRHRDARG
jgi:RHH-type proline utilization regulon transcriptional repressor/proline dehydrogenase/delta 1-pyrroline-5-carboxylate dehydrogenase